MTISIRAALLSPTILAIACASTSTRVDPTGSARPSREAGCEVRFFKSEMPAVPFETLGKVESHVSRNVFGGVAKLEDEGYAELRKQACALGGDAVVVDDHLTTQAAEMNHVHVWARVIKLDAGPAAVPPATPQPAAPQPATPQPAAVPEAVQPAAR